MKDTHLRLTNSLLFHKLGQSLIMMGIFSIILTLITMSSFPNLRSVTMPIAVSVLFLGGIFLMVEFEVSAANYHRIRSWAKTSYGFELEQENMEELYKYSLTEYWDDKNMIQLCLVEKDGKFILCRTIAIKPLERN